MAMIVDRYPDYQVTVVEINAERMPECLRCPICGKPNPACGVKEGKC